LLPLRLLLLELPLHLLLALYLQLTLLKLGLPLQLLLPLRLILLAFSLIPLNRGALPAFSAVASFTLRFELPLPQFRGALLAFRLVCCLALTLSLSGAVVVGALPPGLTCSVPRFPTHPRFIEGPH
jgi:hypothetical protein